MSSVNEMEPASPDKGTGKTVPAVQQVGMAPKWAVIIGILALGVLYALLPQRLTFGPNWLLLVVEVLLLLPIVLTWMTGFPLPHRAVRSLSLVILGVVTVALACGVVLLIVTLPGDRQPRDLLRSAGLLWCFNVLVFALWYWEIDGGGPLKRHQAGHQAADFMFPQQINRNDVGWAPYFLDYLFLAFTGATALSPADTVPLTRVAKALMMAEAMLSLVIIILLAARAVNIL
jgi:uncharacterized membrane protein